MIDYKLLLQAIFTPKNILIYLVIQSIHLESLSVKILNDFQYTMFVQC